MKRRVVGYRIPDEIRAKIVARIRVASVAEVAAEFGVANGSVRNIRNQAGIASRPAGMPKIWSDHEQRKRVRPYWSLRPRGPRPLEWTQEEAAA